MNLRIQIKKDYGEPSTLICTREDGTKTYAKLQVDFEIHDIAHYVVEKQFRLKNAFYGLLSQGYQINDFMLPKGKRPKALLPENLPPEALATEHLVNLLTIDFMQSDTELDIIKLLHEILRENKLSFPERVKKEELNLIQKELENLMMQWNELPNGKSLELLFKID